MRIIDKKVKPKPFIVWACMYIFVIDEDKEFCVKQYKNSFKEINI